jgi:hypothetical protein
MEVPRVGRKMEDVRMSLLLRSGRKMKEGGSRRAITAGLGPGQNQPLKPLKHGSLQQRFSSRAWLT